MKQGIISYEIQVKDLEMLERKKKVTYLIEYKSIMRKRVTLVVYLTIFLVINSNNNNNKRGLICFANNINDFSSILKSKT